MNDPHASEEIDAQAALRRPELLADLTDQQSLAVRSIEGPVLVLAAAGSGKTRVITRRAAFMVLEVGIPPWQVLSITFTNKAAGEMRTRAAQILTPRQAQAMTFATFHSLCARLLRRYADRAGLKPDFSIYDTSDQSRLVKAILKEMDISSNHLTPEGVLSRISSAKNELMGPEIFAAQATAFFERKVAPVYKAYQQRLRQANAVDFDDLLMKVAELLKGDAEARSELQERHQYVQVDEYQDTNHAQFVIADALASAHRNLFVVGDPDQSIYGWRGADLRNIMDFERRYPEAKVIALGQNYRSTPEILAAADALIKNNADRRDKPLWTAKPSGAPVQVVTVDDEEAEAGHVVEWLGRQSDAGRSWSEMAIFYRVNSLSRVMEEALLRANVPYQIARGTAFYQRKEVKDALAYLKTLANPADEVSLERIINTPARGIGDSSLEQVRRFGRERNLPLHEALDQASIAPGVSSRAASAIARFIKMMVGWSRVLEGADRPADFQPGIRAVVEMIIHESGLEAYYRKEDPEKAMNLDELITAAGRFDQQFQEEGADLSQRLRDYLESVSLVADIDAVSDSTGAVTLMTLHAAKGLEFPHVAIIGLEEGLLPHSMSSDQPDKLEEERRLCFVGMTRAMDQLMLTRAMTRTMRGIPTRTIPSQFLRELPKKFIEQRDLSTDSSPWRRGGGASRSWSEFGDQEEDADSPADSSHGSDRYVEDDSSGGLGLKLGSLVRHPQFGLGRVVQLSPKSRPERAVVRFQRVGQKTLVLQFARLELVDENDVF